MPKKKPHVVFLDVDGTLISYDGIFPASAKEALHLARKAGHQMVVCSGRSLCQIKTWFPMELTDGLVTAAGSSVYYQEKLIYSTTFEEEYTRKMVRYFEENQMPFFLQSEEALYSAKWCMASEKALFQEKGLKADAVEEVFGTVEFVDRPWTKPGIEKALYYNCHKEAAQVEKDLDGYFKITDSSFKLSRFCDGEITRAGIDKSAGMDAYLKYVGIPQENSVAFGDGPNDMEMIQFAGLGIAMGNATKELKSIADKICGDVEEDGLYLAFRELGLLD